MTIMKHKRTEFEVFDSDDELGSELDFPIHSSLKDYDKHTNHLKMR